MDKDEPGERGGIGTPATRDEILKTLFDRGLVEYQKKGKKQYVVSTKTGQDFYDCLPDTARYPDMTALWHDQQLEIEKGERDIDSFVDGILSYMGVEIARVMDNGLSLNIEKHPCPECGSAMMLKKAGDKPFWGCSNYPSCKTTLPDDNGKPGQKVAQAAADPSVVCPLCSITMRLREHPIVNIFKSIDIPYCKGSLKAKDGKPVSGQPRPTVSEKHNCKACGEGLVSRLGKKGNSFFWGCSAFPACKTSYPDINGKPNYTATDKKEK